MESEGYQNKFHTHKAYIGQRSFYCTIYGVVKEWGEHTWTKSGMLLRSLPSLAKSLLIAISEMVEHSPSAKIA